MQEIQDFAEIDLFHVMPGYLCNFTCTHCVNDSGPKRKESLSSPEIEAIVLAIREKKPRKLIFTGGEPTLHVPTINTIVAAHPDFGNVEVLLTTNGWYATSEASLEKHLSAFLRLTSVQLSFDHFHGSRISTDDVIRLRKYCEGRGLDFNVSMCISDPSELIIANELQEKIEARIIYQKIEASGRARQNKVAYKYPLFQESVLDKTCPNLGSVTYVCSKGFSVCCSNLVFNEDRGKNEFAHPSLPEHLGSEFYQEIRRSTFREMLQRRGMSSENLSAEMSAPCRLCELIHTGR